MRVAFETFGCRLNQFETDAMQRAVRDAGHDIVDGSAVADTVVVNSCTVTDSADADTRRAVRRARAKHPGARVIVTGCHATVAPREVAALDGVGLVLPNASKHELVGRLGAGAAPDVPVSTLRARPAFVPLAPSPSPQRTRTLLKVQDGCDYRCSFCIVPQARGRSRSLPLREVRSQLRELVAAGTPEVVVTGIHLGSYGHDLRPRITLAQLVSSLLPELGSARLRLSSVDPHELGDDLIDVMGSHPGQVCRHLHLPIQSGDPGVLRAMRRAHAARDFETAVSRLADRIPDVCIGTDVIVGFPGESAAAFEATFTLLDRLPIAYAHVFSYSRRLGTPAATMDGQVPAAEIRQRSRRLRALSALKRREFRERFVGRDLPAVVYRRRDARTGKLAGLTDNYIELAFDGSDALRRSWVRARVGEADGLSTLLP